MSGTGDEGFRPYPGDPWHPEWSKDAEPGDTPPPEPSSDEPDEEPKKRRGLFGRRRDRESDETAADEPVDDGEDEEDVEAPPAPGDYELEDDPFEQVLRAEGRSVRRRPKPEEDHPAPAWTADEEEPSDDLTLPVEQPSWIGGSTGGDAAIESDGFDASGGFEATDEDEDTADLPDADQQDLFAEPAAETALPEPDDEGAPLPESEDEQVLPEPDDGEPALPEPDDWEPALPEPDDEAAALPESEDEQVLPEFDDGEPALPEPDEEESLPPIEGEYGVSGPEAFEALADTAEEDLGAWEAFVEGAAEPVAHQEPAPQPPSVTEPAEPVSEADDLDEWAAEEEPKQRRGWFRRRRDPQEAEPEAEADVWDDQPATPEGAEPAGWDEPSPDVGWAEPEPADHSAFMPPEVDEAGAPDVDDLDGDDDTDAAVEAALAALAGEVEGVEDPGHEPAAAEPVGQEPPAEPVAYEEPEPQPPSVTEPVEQVGGADDLDEWVATDELAAEEPVDQEPAAEEPLEPEPVMWAPDEPRGGDIAGPAAAEDDEPEVEEPVDWQGEGGPVPAAWMSDIDEDEITPPPVADTTPETEWPVAPDDGRWEGRTAWDAEPQRDVFDHEESRVEEPGQPPFRDPVEEPAVPEGFEDWEDAVADATADDDETAEYHVQHVPPPADALPEGFEQFPGPAEPAAPDEDDWMDDHRDIAAHPTEEMDEPYVPDADAESADDLDFDQRIYAAGGTVEHRGLAEAIAAAGDEDDTEWHAMSAAMPGLETGVLGFEDVADLAGDEDYVAPARSNLGVRVLTGVILVGLLFGSLLIGGWAFAVFVGLVVLLGLTEFYTTLRRVGFLPLSLFGLIGAAGTLAATWFHGPVAIPSGIMLTAVATFFFYAFAPTRRDALSNGGLTVLGMAWAAGAVAFAIPIARAAEFEILVLAVVAVTAAMDIGAYSFGRTWGKRPLAPVLSPNKTVEGLVGGTTMALAAAGALGWFEMGPFDLASGLALGAVVVVAAPLGDLAESMLKRTMGVKDMGSTLPGHGGILDRIDALVFVIPSAWVLYETIGLLG